MSSWQELPGTGHGRKRWPTQLADLDSYPKPAAASCVTLRTLPNLSEPRLWEREQFAAQGYSECPKHLLQSLL